MLAVKSTARKSAGSGKTSRLKIERLSMRIDKSAKAKLERAAAYNRKSVSDYVIARALTAAEAEISAHETIALSPDVWGKFYDALESPPPTNAKLRALLRAHDKAIVSR
ncbi:MAG: DUF1778 domain-containing protein [Alphaproteobacteria bacterium]|nr:DUF1778 domain-containing protein [Alphaproteobacteria bacterium]